MPDKEYCVCGHGSEWHRSDERNEFGCEKCGHARCNEFRKVLSWPDQEGWWWITSEMVDSLCNAKETGGVMLVAVCLLDTWREYRGRHSHDLICPQFIKMNEQCPFPKDSR